MINYDSLGEDVTLIAPSGGVVSGVGYLIGSLVVVAAVTVAQGVPFVGRRIGIFRVAKPGSQAWTLGAKVYLDNTAHNFTTTAGGNTLVGVTTLAVGSGAGETEGKVLLDGAVR